MNRQDPAALAALFAEGVGRSPEGIWLAPGRVNVIGEHTDYSDGFVLPMALPQACRVAVARRADAVVRVASRQAGDEWLEFPLNTGPGDVEGWAGYVVGVLWALRSGGHEPTGLDLLLDSDVPLGAGLSSSAAVGCAVALAANDLFGLDLTRLELAAVARLSENEFVGAPTGAMDQAISLLGERDHLLFLDTRDMTYRQVPCALADAGLTLLVIDSRTRHELNDGGGYAGIRRAVEAGAAALGVPVLRDVGTDGLAQRLAGLAPDVAPKVRHVVTENARVLEVVDLLEDGGDPRRIGPVLLAGHASLRDDFGISTPELDTAVEASMAAGAVGARMTGGGFGGSAVALVDTDAVPTVRRAVQTAYAKQGFERPEFLTAVPSAGAHRSDG
ncbi:galactokinase [Spongisporangium articulatum]|uniref:Galactokinase n=1 Tax=Spongisporangium articulatum TaxID=3362603 RepID=A0ABW8AH21_9ACTN